VKERIANLIKGQVQKSMEDVVLLIPQLIEFQNSAKEDRQSYHDHTKDPFGNRGLYSELKDRLIEMGVVVEEVDIDVSDFESWLDDFSEIEEHYRNLGDVKTEKCLEHYLSFRYLKTTTSDVYIDIASTGSPWANILNKRGIKSYELDLIFPNGIHGNKIGADAGNTQLPDSFATVLSAQCAFECFMGDADIRFISEAERILNTGGRYGILPLYLDDTYFVTTSPYLNQNEIIIESKAKKVWRDDEYKSPFDRHYSPESFSERIYSNIPENMTGKVLYFRNLPDVMKHYQGQSIYCYFMLYCEKK
jgi:hypothetical protein